MGLLLRHNPPGRNPRRVFIALPSYGEPNGLTAFSLFQSHMELSEAGYDVELCMLLGDCHVDDARNRLTYEFLQSSCGDLVFVDADVGFRPEDLIRLLSYDRDVVGGVYPKRGDIAEYPVTHIGGDIFSDSDGLIEVAGLPAGFLRIRRNVLETLAKDAKEYWMHGECTGKVKQIFERLIVDGNRVSSDNAFCMKWRAKGGKVFVDPDCYLDHRGNKTWSGTLGTHLRRINGLGLGGLKAITQGTETDQTYLDLMLEWGNMPFAASPELIKAAVMVARQIDGPILEIGTGLTTLAMAAANPKIQVHALEHDGAWEAALLRNAKRCGITNITVHCNDLKRYERGRWYDYPELPWKEFQLILCDGPPRAEGVRDIVWDVMREHGGNPKCILVDDADERGKFIPEPYRCEIKGLVRQFAVGLRN